MATVHSKINCPYCVKTVEFLATHDIPHEVIHYDPSSIVYETQKNDLVAKTNFMTFPQIFVGNDFLGGYTELMHAYETLKLHELLEKLGINLEIDF